MEPETTFDLTTALQSWRHSMAGAPGMRAQDLDELEAHLRDSIDNLRRGGLNLEEGFLVATRRLGAGPRLAVEFRKVHAQRIWLERALWMVVGVMAAGAVTSIASSCANLAAIVAGAGWVTGWARGLLALMAFLLGGAAAGLAFWGILRRPDRARFARRNVHAHPVLTATAIGLAAMLFVGFSGLSSMAMISRVTPTEFGQYYQWSQMARFVISLLAWPALLGWLLVMRARERFAAA